MSWKTWKRAKPRRNDMNVYESLKDAVSTMVYIRESIESDEGVKPSDIAGLQLSIDTANAALSAVGELVARMDAINSDTEGAHVDADGVLLDAVPADVKDAFKRCEDRHGHFWYA
jgi:hypothetical protein